MAAKYEIFVEDQLIDIDPGQVIAGTFQASALASGDVVNRKASYTNQINAPRTNNNISIFGFSNFINSGATFPFTKKTVRINANGLEILRGVVIIKSFETSFSLQIFSTGKDLLLAMGTKKLDELDFGDSPITWNPSYWDTKRASTTGLCAPVINYGQIDETLANGTIGNYYLPSVSYKDILTQILSEAGYTVSGTFYTSDAFFNNMVMTYGRKDWPGTSFKINEILPDNILQADFVKDFLIRFGAYFRFDGLDIEIITLEEILTDTANAVDWSAAPSDGSKGKRANKKNATEYTWQDFAQSNYFRYPEQDFPDKVLDPYVSRDGILSVANENLITAKDPYYKSIFSRDEAIPGHGSGFTGNIIYNIASVSNNIFAATQPIWETVPSNYEFDNTPKPMLCLLRDPTTFTGPIVEGSIRYDGNVRTDYKIAFFAIPPLSVLPLTEYSPALNNMAWQNNFGTAKGLLDLYYPTLQGILTAGTYKVTREYLLNTLDIYELDLLRLVYDEGQYFLISRLREYVTGRITKAELLKL